MSESDTSVGQLSPDGHWRWDGSQWQPAGQDAQQQQPQSQASAGDQSGSTAVGQLSPDGNWQWDGSQWQPAGQSGGAGAAAGAAAGGQSLAEAFAQQGLAIDASVIGDGQAIGRVVGKLQQWYSALDGTHKAVVESLCSQGMTYLLADPAVAVVSEGAEFLQALAATGLTLEQALGAASSALQSHGSGTATA
ncbi:MAG TPA: hypothetical protein VGM10_00650 [Actinocrinis sp.]